MNVKATNKINGKEKLDISKIKFDQFSLTFKKKILVFFQNF